MVEKSLINAIYFPGNKILTAIITRFINILVFLPYEK